MKPKRARYLATVLIIVAMFGAIFWKMYDMQVVTTDTYVQKTEERTTKTLTLYGMRGTIYDSGMNPLAYSKRSYDVQFYRDPSQTTKEQRAAYTESIIQLIELVESKGRTTITEFWMTKNEEGKWVIDTGSEVESVAAKREKQWRENFSVTTVPEEQLFETLCTNYSISKDMPEEEKLKVLAIWQESRMNAFKPEPVTVAYNVSFETVAEIEARSMDLLGVSITESSTRVYPKKSSAAHAIGYTSKISGEETMAAYKERGYPNDAVVGMTGIEYSMETELSPYVQMRQGKRTVQLNNRGKIIKELSYQAPVNGNDIILTLDMRLQAVGEAALERTINGIANDQRKIMNDSSWKAKNRTELRRYATLEQPVKTAETGAFVAIDPNSGRVLALGNYPSYDLSMFGSGTVDPDAWREVVEDERNPMYNRAISSRDTPGSIFKMVTALGSLMEGNLTLDRRINDDGEFKKTDASYHPTCWISKDNRYLHQNQTVIEGIKNSCNFFFYTIGFELGATNLNKWGAQFGLTSKTFIELPNESTSFVGNQLMLYDSTRAISDQYTSKPIFAAAMIKRAFRRIGAELDIEYDEERLDKIAKQLLDIVNEPGDKTEWIPKIQNLLINEGNLKPKYIAQNFLVNEFFYYLSDLRWTSNETIMASIGQSITQVTPVAVSRYVAAVANGGTVYDLQLIDKIVSPTGEVVLDKQPVVANRITGADEYFAALQEGMREVASVENDGTAAQQFAKYSAYKIAAKTGTAQRSKVDIENNSWLVTYAPYDDPQIVVVVYIQNGYAGARSAHTAISIITDYLDSQKLKDKVEIAETGRLTF